MRPPLLRSMFVVVAVALASACSGGGGSGAPNVSTGGSASAPAGGSGAASSPSPSPTPTATATSSGGSSAPALDARFTLAPGFYGNTIAAVGGARELAALPNGDLLVGTTGTSIYIVPNAEAQGAASAPRVFATLSEGPAEGVTYAPNGAIYAASTSTIWRIAYTAGAQTGTAVPIARVRQGSIAPNSDGDVHRSTSVAANATTLYAGVGSSCNACVETDPTRATVQRMNLDGTGMTGLTTRTRNPIALAIDPASSELWIGGAGQDGLAYGHPYEYVDSPTLRGNAGVDYGWPQCEEDHVAYNALHVSPAPDCSSTVAPAIEFPAYATLIGATFYPAASSGTHAFPAAYRGGLFVAAHGSWHCCPATPPRVFFVAMNGDAPATAVNWSDPTVQSTSFLAGLGSTSSSSSYIARPTGIAVGPQGSLFVADDQNGAVYRFRPNGT